MNMNFSSFSDEFKKLFNKLDLQFSKYFKWKLSTTRIAVVLILSFSLIAVLTSATSALRLSSLGDAIFTRNDLNLKKEERDVPFSERYASHRSFEVPFQFVICAKVAYENAYLLEWVEFHRLQGIKKFALFADDLPSDPRAKELANDVHTLSALYDQFNETRGLIDSYEISSLLRQHIPSLMHKGQAESSLSSHRMGQQAMLKVCYETYRDVTEWVIHIDIDEFLYSAKNETLSEYFQTFYTRQDNSRPNSGSLVQNYRTGNFSGLYVPSVMYGPGPRVLAPRNGLRAAAVNGKIHPYFDPLDSFINKKVDSEIHRDLKTDLSEDEKIELMVEARKSQKKYFLPILRRIFPNGLKNIDRDILHSVILEVISERESEYKQNEAPPAPVFPPSSSMSITNRIQNDLKSKELLNLIEKRRIDGSIKDDNEFWSLVESIEDIIENGTLAWSDEYPLIISDQIMRGPTFDIIDGEKYEDVAEYVIDNFEICRSYTTQIVNHSNLLVRVDENTLHTLIGLPPHRICVPGSLPAFVTSMGKSLTWTGKRFRRPSGFEVPFKFKELEAYKSRLLNPQSARYNSQLANSQLHFVKRDIKSNFDPDISFHKNKWDKDNGAMLECHQPWIHFCSHQTTSPWLLVPKEEGLRLDHHAFRSIEDRFTRAPNWRLQSFVNRLGKDKLTDLKVLEFASILPDPSKLKFAKQIRSNIASFGLQTEYHLLKSYRENIKVHNDHVDKLRVESVSLINKCNTADVLSRRVYMCPSNYPKVGLFNHGVVPPNVLLPKAWCVTAEAANGTLQTIKAMVTKSKKKLPDSLTDIMKCDQSGFINDDNFSCDVMRRMYPYGAYESIKTESVAICPGWPEYQCCDYDDDLWTQVSTLFNFTTDDPDMKFASSTFRDSYKLMPQTDARANFFIGDRYDKYWK